jgi:ABC-type polysaccharide/polyol phosphate transport system ATPase subunit
MARISAKNLDVRFAIFDYKHTSLKYRALSLGRGPKTQAPVVHALRGISFEVKDGDRVGLIGHNGSGKSTLLRTMAGIYRPRDGHLITEGSRASLFNVSAGLDADATGHENIRLLGVSAGLSLKQVEQYRDDIVAFAQLGDAMQRPVRTYSAGMQLRLAFGVSTAAPADILLIDEVIGVGDANFQNRATERLTHLMGQAKILVMASHAEGVLAHNCNRGIVLDHGSIAFDGSITDALAFAKPPATPAPNEAPRRIVASNRRPAASRNRAGRSAPTLFPVGSVRR